MADGTPKQQLSCCSLAPGLFLLAGAYIGYTKANWLGIVVGSILGLAVGVATVMGFGSVAAACYGAYDRIRRKTDGRRR